MRENKKKLSLLILSFKRENYGGREGPSKLNNRNQFLNVFAPN